MQILTQDRVRGLSATKSPLSSYGPGNMLDDSNRNSWVSGDVEDTLVVNCNSQVNGLFLGRYQADEIFLTYFGRELRSQITSTGAMTIGYELDVTAARKVAVSGGFEVTLVVDSTAKVNVNDVIEVTGIVSGGKDSSRNLAALNPAEDYPARTSPGDSSACGFQKVTKVQTGNTISELNSSTGQTDVSSVPDSENSITYKVITDPQKFELGILDTTPATIGGLWQANQSNVSCSQGETSGSGTGATFKIDTDSSGLPTFTFDDFGQGYKHGDTIRVEDPGTTGFAAEITVTFNTGSIVNGINNLHLVGGSQGAFAVSLVDSEKGIYEYTVTIADAGLFGSTNTSVSTSPNPFVVGQKFHLSGLNAAAPLGGGYLNGTHVVTASSSTDKTFKFRAYHSQLPSLIAGNVYISLSTSVFFDGGTLLHDVGAVSGTRLKFNNTDALRFKDSTTTHANINAIGDDGLLTYLDDQSNVITEGALRKGFVKATVKDQYKFSYLVPYFFSSTSNSGNAITDGSLQKYVTDTSDTLVTREGAGSQIHKARISVRTQTSLANFVTGDLVLVKSSFLPLPREAHPSEIQLDYSSVINRNAAGLFNEWMLEEVINEGSPVTVTALSYNATDNGKLVVKLSTLSHGFEVDDLVNLTIPTDLLFGSDFEITGFSGNGSTTVTTSNTLSNVYVGMTITGTGVPANTTVTELVSNTQCKLSNAVNGSFDATFSHPSSAKDDGDMAFNRVHRVIAVSNDRITMYAPNFGSNVDLKRKTEVDFLTTSGTNTQLAIYSSPTSGRFAQKVKGGKGRFVRPITGSTEVEQRIIEKVLWNGGSTTVTYTVNSTEYEVPAGTATAIFASPHGLVNNDKIILFGLAKHAQGQYLVNLESSYLVTYSSSNVCSFNIPQANQKTVTTQTAASGSKVMTLVTSADHGFAVGDTINLYNSSTTTYNGTYEIKSVTTSKSFTIELASAPGSNVSLTSQSALATAGVHLRNGSTYQTSGDNAGTLNSLNNIQAVRAVSVEDADSGFEKPIAVGNIVYIDGHEESSSFYNNGLTAKTPVISDATRSANYDSGNVFSIQSGFIGRNFSTQGQISKVVGDGTSKSNIELVSAVGKVGQPLEFTTLTHAILTGILRAGVSQNFPNPQQGLSNSFQDYSVRKELATGSYYFLNRESAKQFSGRIVGSPEEIDKFVDFGQNQLAEPFAVLVVSGTGTDIKKLRIRAAVYGYFTALPTANYQNKLATLKNANFTIKEVL